MPKPRVIDPGFSDDLDTARLTRDERLLLVIMISRCADDYGRLIAHPAYLRKQAFGYDEDLSIDDVAQMRVHILEHCRNVMLYTANGQEYIYLTNWDKYQKIKYHVASKLPPPPNYIPPSSGESDTTLGVDSPDSGESGDNLGTNSPPIFARVGLGSIELGGEELGSAVEGSKSSRNTPPTSDSSTAQASSDSDLDSEPTNASETGIAPIKLPRLATLQTAITRISASVGDEDAFKSNLTQAYRIRRETGLNHLEIMECITAATQKLNERRPRDPPLKKPMAWWFKVYEQEAQRARGRT